jgi:hypothetical protein
MLTASVSPETQLSPLPQPSGGEYLVSSGISECGALRAVTFQYAVFRVLFCLQETQIEPFLPHLVRQITERPGTVAVTVDPSLSRADASAYPLSVRVSSISNIHEGMIAN